MSDVVMRRAKRRDRWRHHRHMCLQRKRREAKSDAVIRQAKRRDRRRHWHRPVATQEKRMNESRLNVTSEVKGPTARRAHAVCNAREATQRATPSCDERGKETDGALQRKRSEAMNDAVVRRARRRVRRRHRHTLLATQKTRSHERRRHATSEAKGPTTVPLAHAVRSAREKKK